ncbi:HAD family hydrolase [uncultured Psychrobacter sp.]|uniref:HAD family hydrolase n=1 Tax=uncultured Psychrobacter sp. TaxID=259303 RepID=UPI0034578BC2
MKPTALFIGSIGVLAETSDIQRRAYNQALKEAGLDWHWDKDTYRDLLTDSGGVKRLTRLNKEKEANLSQDDIERIHARKTELACQEIVNEGITLRPGVAELIDQALQQGIKLALVTSTYQDNIDAIAKAAGDDLPLDKFSAVLTRDDADASKPAPDVYLSALKRLSVDASEVIAVEDSSPSLQAAKQAGIYTVVTPGNFTDQQDFSAADKKLTSLEGFELNLPK